MHWRRKWQPTAAFLPGESQGQRSLVGFRLWGRTESDTTEATQQQQKQQQHTYIYMHVCAKLLQSGPTLYDPMDCSLPGSSIRGIFQARTLEWVAIALAPCKVFWYVMGRYLR